MHRIVAKYIWGFSEEHEKKSLLRKPTCRRTDNIKIKKKKIR
jgi:hypothetical protein